MHADAAILLRPTVFKFINRCVQFDFAVALINHTTKLDVSANYLRGQKLSRAQVCCRGLCSSEDS